jgi:pyruvate,water dikinase
MRSPVTLPLSKLTMKDLRKAGGKNASLGEMLRKLSPSGIHVPDGFAVTASAYFDFLDFNLLHSPLQKILSQLNTQTLENLSEIGKTCREMIMHAVMPDHLVTSVMDAYHDLEKKYGPDISVAVRSSATAEDLPTASFAGQHDSFLNVSGVDQLLLAVQKCYASLFNDRAIKYRIDKNIEHLQVGISVGVQLMVRADKGCAGVAFTIDPETGFQHVIYITGAWGLGDNIVQGAVNPDEFYCFKPSIDNNKTSLIYRRLGQKEQTMVLNDDPGAEKPVKNIPTPPALQQQWVLTDAEVEKLARWCYQIEKHYNMPMDIEWAKDGVSGELFIVQARPETVHRKHASPIIRQYQLHTKAQPLCRGKAVGQGIVNGRVCIIHSLADSAKVKKGDIIVADMTNPDWNALLKKAVSIITNKGGRTSHASIVARELGIPAVVGTLDATQKLSDGQLITVSCTEGDAGLVYDGILDFTIKEVPVQQYNETRTWPMLILADPDRALQLSFYPNKGVGLLRMEFIISNTIQVHPMALVKYHELPDTPEKKIIDALTRHFTDKRQYFIRTLSEAIALVAAAFYPKDVIVRMSDFKTNEYARLIGGKYFEPEEENPMLGFRGASRYYHERYREAFALECLAIKRVREELGLTNVMVMIPFCRTVEEGEKTLQLMKTYGLERGKDGLNVYVMAELPSNVILASEFARIFDGFSIGSNDLTQLILGLDRDSAIVSGLFDENNAAVKSMVRQVIQAAHQANKKIGLCGQAPSDFPEFTRFLVNEGIDSISFTPDALLKGIENIIKAEKECDQQPVVQKV